MRIAFTGNHGRTALFMAAAEILEASGHEVCWIATGSHRMRGILASVHSGKILDLSSSDTSADKRNLSMLEKNSPFTVNGIISADRILREKPYDIAAAYLSSVFEKVLKFISDKGVEMVFGEATWAHELVTEAVCRHLGIPFLSPVNVRYPSGRFAFFKGAGQGEMVRTGNVADMTEGQRLHRELIERGSRPFYMDRRGRGTVKPLLYHLRRHLTGDTEDMTVPSLFHLIRNNIKKRSPIFSNKPSGRYVYLPLQCSPEASLDVLAGYYSSRAEFVRNAARAVPYGIRLAVREHPLQRPSGSFYRELAKIPSVEMVSSLSDGQELIRNAEAVISVSGTACYEAGLYGVPAVTFADVFFNELPTVRRCFSFEDLREDIEQVIHAEPDGRAVISFLAKLYSASYAGYAESEAVYADALSPDNVRLVADAFADVIAFYSSSKSATADSI